MPYDPYQKLYNPDLQPAELPQWQPMGDDDQGQQAGQATGSFVDLLKKRMAGGSAAGGSKGGATMGAEGKAGGGGTGNGMESL